MAGQEDAGPSRIVLRDLDHFRSFPHHEWSRAVAGTVPTHGSDGAGEIEALAKHSGLSPAAFLDASRRVSGPQHSRRRMSIFIHLPRCSLAS